jgi:hypothetical protein
MGSSSTRPKWSCTRGLGAPRGQNLPPEEVGKAGGVTGHVELFAGLARHPRVRLIEVSVQRHRGPWEVMLAGMRAYLGACMEATVIHISLIDAPSVLGCEARGRRPPRPRDWPRPR